MTKWEIAKMHHEEAGLDYLQTLSYYMDEGYIMSTPGSLIFAETMGDAWAIGYAYGEGAIPNFINAMPFWLPKVAWRRALRRRHGIETIDTERLCAFFKVDSTPLKLRTR